MKTNKNARKTFATSVEEIFFEEEFEVLNFNPIKLIDLRKIKYVFRAYTECITEFGKKVFWFLVSSPVMTSSS